jgi:hypothetical protein
MIGCLKNISALKNPGDAQNFYELAKIPLPNRPRKKINA